MLNYMHKWASRRKLHFTQLPAYTFALHYALLLLLSIVYLLHCTKLWFSFYVLNYASLHLFFFALLWTCLCSITCFLLFGRRHAYSIALNYMILIMHLTVFSSFVLNCAFSVLHSTLHFLHCGSILSMLNYVFIHVEVHVCSCAWWHTPSIILNRMLLLMAQACTFYLVLKFTLSCLHRLHVPSFMRKSMLFFFAPWSSTYFLIRI